MSQLPSSRKIEFILANSQRTAESIFSDKTVGEWAFSQAAGPRYPIYHELPYATVGAHLRSPFIQYLQSNCATLNVYQVAQKNVAASYAQRQAFGRSCL